MNNSTLHMKRTIYFFLMMALGLTASAQSATPAQGQSPQTRDRYQANWESLQRYTTPDWFRDAKFGIFIHWGVYSVPAFGSEWYPRNMYDSTTPEYRHHVATYGSQKNFGYKDFIPQFKADKFDAAKWVTRTARYQSSHPRGLRRLAALTRSGFRGPG